MKRLTNESSTATCDMCGYTGHEDDFEIVPGYGFLCYDCQQDVKKSDEYKRYAPITSDVINAESKKQKKEDWWMGVPGAKYYYHGDWSDPEIVYDGFSFSYWDVIEGFIPTYREEHPEDKDDKGFDYWFDEQGSDYIQGHLDDMVYAEYGDQVEKADDWLGIPEAYVLSDISTHDEFFWYKGYRIEGNDFADRLGFDIDYDNAEFSQFIRDAEAGDEKNIADVKKALDECIKRMGYVSRTRKVRG